jgi:hypothetical protein
MIHPYMPDEGLDVATDRLHARTAGTQYARVPSVDVVAVAFSDKSILDPETALPTTIVLEYLP